MNPVREELIELETAFWRAAGDRDFYQERFADDGVMAFHVGIMSKNQVLEAMAGADEWESFTFDDVHFVPITDDVAALTYTTIAAPVGYPEVYRAAITSVYAKRNETWTLVLHQQTPLLSP